MILFFLKDKSIKLINERGGIIYRGLTYKKLPKYYDIKN